MNKFIKELIYAYNKNKKTFIFIFLFRISHFLSSYKLTKLIGFPFRLFYIIISEYVYGVEIKDTTQIGYGLILHHRGHGTVIGPAAIIGDYVSIRHNTTIGGVTYNGVGKRPKIGNNVEIGPGSCILGGIIIGNNVKIGANSVVVKDVPDNCIIAGNPAKIIRILE